MVELEDLRRLELFGHLPIEMLRRLVAKVGEVMLAAGEYAVHEGEVPAFFVLLSGKMELTKRVAGIERVVSVRDDPGAFFGEVSLVLGSLTIANLRAAVPTRMVKIDPVDFRWLINEAPEFSARVIASAMQRVEGLERIAVETPPSTVMVFGDRWDAKCHELRDFLARNQIAFDFLDLDDPYAKRIVPDLDAHAQQCPIVRLPDATMLFAPPIREVAARVGVQVTPHDHCYDVAVIGGGPAGLASAVYGASEGLRTIMIEREAPGGQAGTSSRIENYLGFPTGLPGDELGHRALEQAKRFGAEILVTREVRGIDLREADNEIVLDGDEVLHCRAIILATGVSWRMLSVPGIERLIGSGVYYGAARAEAAGTRGQDVYLVGGGNSAGQAAMFFSNYARTVTLLLRGDGLARSMSHYLIEQIGMRDNIRVELNSEVVAVYGDRHLEAIEVRNRPTGETTRRATDALFVFIGADAKTDWLPPEIARDELGYILTGLDLERDGNSRWSLTRDPFMLETSIAGVFAAGDVRHGSVKRVAAGVGEGSMAIAFVHQYLASREPAGITS
jgi:thioredoxin reductase (NADPH)